MIQLSLPMQDASWTEVNTNTVDVKVLILYPYYVEADKNGNSFDIKKEDVYALYNKYNASVRSKWQKLKKLGRTLPLKYVEDAPNILDHDPKAYNTVGHVIGELEIVEKDEVPYLFATLRVKGRENVERVSDKRFSQVSIGFDPKNHILGEISWVVKGAIPGAGAIMSDGSKSISNNVTTSREYNPVNLLNLRMSLLSQYDFYRKEKEEIQKEIDIENMLTNLSISGKILPRDKIRIKTQLSKISDKKARFEAFNLLSENLITVIDYSIRGKNKSSINWEDNLMSVNSKPKVLDMQKVAYFAANNLSKGSKSQMSEDDKALSSKDSKADMGEKSKFSKKDLKHCLSIKEDEKELSKYLSTFLSEDEGDDEDASMSAEVAKVQFSTEMKAFTARQDETDKKLEQLLNHVAVLSKGTEESVALFKQITQAVELQKA
jgi:hypothetical protein